MKPIANLFHRHWSLSAKILLGYISPLALAAILGVFAIIQLNRVNATVNRLTGPLSQEQELAEKVVIQIYRIRLYADQYILEGQQSQALANYNQALVDAQTLLDEGDRLIREPGRVDLQSRVRSNFNGFSAAFADIVQLLTSRQELETDVLLPQYASAMDGLAVLRNNSFAALDFTSAQYASQARDTFSQMQLNLNQYLTSGDEQYAQQIETEYNTIHITLGLLSTSLQVEADRTQVKAIDGAASTYHDGFLNLQTLVSQQREQIDQRLDVFGPAVEQSAAEIARSINTEFSTQSMHTNQLVSRTFLGVAIAILGVVLIGLVSGLALSKVITRPVRQVARAAQGIAAGALDQNVVVQSGDELGVLAEAFNNMTAQVRETMTELRQSNETLKAIIDVSPLAIVLLDMENNVQLWNPAAERIFGWTAGEVIGQPNPIVPEDHLEDYHSLTQEVLESGNVISQELVRQRKDGNPIQVLLSSAMLYDPLGKPRARMKILDDITERKNIEKALRDTQLLYENIIRLSPELIVVTSEAGIYLAASESHERITGYRLDEVIGQSVSEFLIWENESDRDRILQVLNQRGIVSNIEQRFYRKSGELFTALLSMARVEYGDESCLVSIVTDITARKQAEEEIRRLNTELEQRVLERTQQLENANKELESFSYSVSHDLRAPLRAVDGFSRIIQEEYNAILPEEAARLLKLVRTSAQQMGRLIDDLLRFSRLNRQALVRQRVDMNDLVLQALQMLDPERAGRQVEITRAEVPGCWGDPGLLLQVWVNLLSNALKFTRQTSAAHIEVACLQSESDDPVYLVRDNGVGFNMDYASKLFGVFQRLHSADQFEGTGVGLALVQRIILRHGGRIWVEAHPDEGATFYFTVGGE